MAPIPTAGGGVIIGELDLPMTTPKTKQLVSYIAHAAPATRRPARSDEPFLRPEIGFTPKWFHEALGIEFGETWHTDPEFRRDSIVAMATETTKRFGQAGQIGIMQEPDQPLDLLTGTFGALVVPGIYGVPIKYQSIDWPWSQHGQFLNDAASDALEPPTIDSNPFWEKLMEQLDWIERTNGRVEGFINWQGVLNSAYRLRGEEIFPDMISEPERVKHILGCVAQTMIDGIRRLYERQRKTGVELTHVTISNCLVNLISPDDYEEFLLPFDRQIAEAFDLIGIHNCAWNADGYTAPYATLPNVAYIDMGIESDLKTAKARFANARRALMYTPMDVHEKSLEVITSDFDRIARDYGPCDIVLADIDYGVPDERVRDLIDLCHRLSDKYADAGSL